MDYALKKRIGKPELFTGRKEELAYFLKWINDIKEEKSMSTAILARRKMGKTAVMERLFNITFFKNDGVIPFYYEIKEFELKFAEVKKLENIERAVDFIFSRSGFTKEAENYCREKGIACSEDESWLE